MMPTGRPPTRRVVRVIAFAAAAVLMIDIGAAVGWTSIRAGATAKGSDPSTTIGTALTTTTTRPRTTSTTAPPVTDATTTTNPSETTTTSTTDGTQTTVPPGSQALPPPGYYTYATSGYEKISLGQPRSFPATTVVEVGRSGCGESEIWKPDDSHRESIGVCPAAGGLHVVYDETTVVFDGEASTNDLVCSGDSFIPVTTGQVGQQWTFTCADSSTTAYEDVTFIGDQSLTINDEVVNTVHVEMTSTLSGSENGTGQTDYWLTDNAVVAQESSSLSASTETDIGEVTYTSSYTLELDSLQPQT